MDKSTLNDGGRYGMKFKDIQRPTIHTINQYYSNIGWILNQNPNQETRKFQGLKKKYVKGQGDSFVVCLCDCVLLLIFLS